MKRNPWLVFFGLLASAAFVFWGFFILIRKTQSENDQPSQGEWQIIRPPFDVSAIAMQDGIVWAGGKDGLYWLDQNSTQPVEEFAPGQNLELVRALLVDAAGILWVGHQNGLSRYKDGEWRTFTISDGLPDNRVNVITLDQKDRMWVGTWGGVAILEDDSWSSVSQADGLLDNMVNVILHGQNGGIWFGSYVAPRGGLSYLKDDHWEYFDTSNGLPHNNITCLEETESGDIWVGTGLFDRGGAVAFQTSEIVPKIVQRLSIENGLAGEKVRSIFEDRDGVLWIGSEYDGLVLMSGNKFLKISLEDGLSHPEIKTIIQDERGNIWLGTRDGITRIPADALRELYARLLRQGEQ